MVEQTTSDFSKCGEAIAIGIDLGVSNACAAIYYDGVTHLIPNPNGKTHTQAYVSFQSKDESLVGYNAYQKVSQNIQATVFGTKRMQGRKFDDPNLQHYIKNYPFKVVGGAGGKPMVVVKPTKDPTEIKFSVMEITAKLLSHCKKYAQEHLGVQKISNVVLTVPGNFTHSQRSETSKAASKAGFAGIRIINQPTAAALAYAVDKLALDDEQEFLVWNFGGGSLDVSLLTIDGGEIRVKATEGDPDLGGEDFTTELVNHCIKEGTLNLDARQMFRLRKACDEAKQQLSTRASYEIVVDSLTNGEDFELEITREQFEQICAPLFERCKTLLSNIYKNTEIDKNHVDQIIVVGGASRMPKVQEDLQKFFGGKALNHQIRAEQATVTGAAMEAAKNFNKKDQKASDNLKGMAIYELSALFLGYQQKGKDFKKIKVRNQPLPYKQFADFTTDTDGQTDIAIQVYQGVTEDNKQLIKDFNLSGLPSKPAGSVNYNISFEVDKNGILTVKPNRANLPGDFTEDQKNAISIVEVAHKTLRSSLQKALLKKFSDTQENMGVVAQSSTGGMSVTKLFDQIAAERKKPRAALERFVEVFAGQGITTFDQISLEVVQKQEDSKAIPVVICNFIRDMVKERESQTTDFVHKECLILWQSNYSDLRALDYDKAKELGDLGQAEQDSENSQRIAQNLGISKEHTTVLNGAKTKDVDKALEDIYDRMVAKDVDEDNPAFLFVYVAGHGVAAQQQYFVTNDKNRACLVQIERNLRALASLKDGLKIIAFYDVCRQDKGSVPELTPGEKHTLWDNSFQEAGEEYSYMHLCTQPGKLVDAASVLCASLEKKLDEEAKKNAGVIELPSALLTMASVEKTTNGGTYSLKWKQ